jgi:hypothetical protein
MVNATISTQVACLTSVVMTLPLQSHEARAEEGATAAAEPEGLQVWRP